MQTLRLSLTVEADPMCCIAQLCPKHAQSYFNQEIILAALYSEF